MAEIRRSSQPRLQLYIFLNLLATVFASFPGGQAGAAEGESRMDVLGLTPGQKVLAAVPASALFITHTHCGLRWSTRWSGIQGWRGLRQLAICVLVPLPFLFRREPENNSSVTGSKLTVALQEAEN
ncbi:uncharacterized protein LOC108135527 isoform X2 [Drosophila elegans]|uniref:uncharacterized protein LOC108135527 isoform X2 n=1 Tax=Drosophila elegans TaxID=30023 RepID=UPI001BC82EBC|nr:uncharacterized protein LOC108135527 isoform X2 [Drosophila elegans]